MQGGCGTLGGGFCHRLSVVPVRSRMLRHSLHQVKERMADAPPVVSNRVWLSPLVYWVTGRGGGLGGRGGISHLT